MDNMNTNINKLNSNWVTGFVDGDGCFYVKVTRDGTYKIGWTIKPQFIIKLHKRDEKLLKKMKLFFNDVGKIRITNNSVYYEVNIKDQLLNTILSHYKFESYISYIEKFVSFYENRKNRYEKFWKNNTDYNIG